MKKHYLYLTIILIGSILAGCANDASTSMSTNSSGSQTTTSTSEEKNKYTITWKNYDGTVLEVDKNVSEGTMPSYDGETPLKPSDFEYVYTWKGWNPEVVPAKANQTYTATFSSNDEPAKKYGTKPLLSSDGKTITYGLYPQTNVNDASLISALNELTTPESNGWYLYNDEFYAKAVAIPYDLGYKFDNGTAIVSGTTYWFKCEPIVWNVLSNNDGEYYIVSNVLLDVQRYGEKYSDTKQKVDYKGESASVYANNYKYSDIRTWLNVDFYNSAFALNNEYIQTTEVDNSAATTDSASNSYACENTLDKVFLPSYKDYVNSGYGFSTSTSSTSTRYSKTTDWARAIGAYYYTRRSDYQYNGYYWTRSPCSGISYYAWCVDSGGYLDYDNVDLTDDCVRPGLSIKID